MVRDDWADHTQEGKKYAPTEKADGLEGLDEGKLMEAVKAVMSMLKSKESALPPPREEYSYQQPSKQRTKQRTEQFDDFETQEIVLNVQQQLNDIIQSLSPEDLRIIDKFAIRKAMSIDDYVELHAPFIDSRIVALALSLRPYLAKQGKENLIDLFLKGLNIVTLIDDIKTKGLLPKRSL